MGLRVFFAGANPSCLWARAGYTLDKSLAHLMAEAAMQGAIRSNLGFSILLRDTSTCSSAQPSPELGFEPATFQSLIDLLYPLGYSRPSLKSWILKWVHESCQMTKTSTLAGSFL